MPEIPKYIVLNRGMNGFKSMYLLQQDEYALCVSFLDTSHVAILILEILS